MVMGFDATGMPMLCVYPGCIEESEKDDWCNKHWGLFPHKCETYGCDRTVVYNDEPWCFTHSPDEGSSMRGYSAFKNAGY